MRNVAIVFSFALGLAACNATVPMDAGTGGPFLADLPDRLVELAGPKQDLEAVKLLPDDGCYWYRYAGPVETTLLPLRTADGRPICTQRAAETATSG